MHLPFDILIVIGIVGFYIYDSAQLYFYNEFNITKGIRPIFNFQHISKTLNCFNKYLVIPNLFLSHQLIFKCAWKIKNISSPTHLDSEDNIKIISKTLRPLQFLNILLFWLTIGILPILIIFKFGYIALTITVSLIYLLNVFSIIFVITKRKVLQLSWSKVMQLLLDILLCPPFALNLLRKISLNYNIETEGTVLAAQILNTDNYQNLLNEIVHDIQTLKTASNDKNVIQLELREQQLLSLKNQTDH
ncbi:hypothetical protein AAV96_15335 [Acinetobacter sp. AG1]|uniref:hypothetical protein n=1 Tax=Acinetobacter TaxID=469 RepID=UPI0006295D71|nr:hypothetical protein [Acinetobacter sp. AG1]KKW75972.1 hypothetical protein AAV96_15335 [Acinetobacter sp. AG1]OJU92791.1 MAG: hypothetical protein BGO19_04170 [Acinetobacter sp. 38-8]